MRKKLFFVLYTSILLVSFSLCTPSSFAQATLSEATTTSVVTIPPSLNPLDPRDIENKVRVDFASDPIMISIAKCESGFRQFNTDGTVLSGGSGGMIGIFQISSLHITKAVSLGFDITTVEGNIGYARYLYMTQSTDPWISSISCWNTAIDSNGGTPESGLLSKNLSFGMIDPQIVSLQQILNRSGFPVAVDGGPGSPGLETNKFGALTRAAVRNFQCTKVQVCSGNEYTTGYGLVDARTRSLLLSQNETPALNTSTSTVTSPVPSTVTMNNTADSPEIQALKTKIQQLLAIVQELQKQLADLRV